MPYPALHGLSRHADLVAVAARIRDGDRSAEIEFLVCWTPAIREIVRSHCRPGESQAEDLLQEIMCRLLGRLRAGGIHDLQALPRYVTTMARNTCTAFYRQQGTRLRTFIDDVPEPVEFDPAQIAHQEQLAQLVRELVWAMTVPRDRELLKRFYLHGHTAERVCADLGIARDHFHRVTHRARTRMLAAMRQRGVFDNP